MTEQLWPCYMAKRGTVHATRGDTTLCGRANGFVDTTQTFREHPSKAKCRWCDYIARGKGAAAGKEGADV